MMDSRLYKKIEALCIGPNIDDNRLEQFIQACVNDHNYLRCIIPNLHQLSHTTEILDGSGIQVSAAIAYPLGNIPLEVKQVQIEKALEDNTNQIDIMMRLESLNAGDFSSAREEAEMLIDLANQKAVSVSLIANLALLHNEAKLAAAETARDCQATLKTASGMGVETSIEDVLFIRTHFRTDLEITACGNIQLVEQAFDFLHAGANRICTTSPFSIITGLERLIKHGYQEK